MKSTAKNQIATGMGLLRRWLGQLGIEDYTGLKSHEKKTYDQWESVLTKELQLEDLRNFLQKQIPALAKELREAVQAGEDKNALFLSARIENYEAIVAFIDEPDRSRETLIAHITNLLSNEA